VIHRDPTGRIVPAGLTERRLYEPYIPGAAHPSWLETQAGTATFVPTSSAGGPGYVQIATAATVNAGARLRTTFQVYPSIYDEVAWTLYGLRFDTDTPSNYQVRFEISETGLDRGIALVQIGDGTCTLRAYTAAGVFEDTPLNYAILGASAHSRRPRNLTLLWRPKQQVAYVLENDQVMGSGSTAAATAAAGCRPMLTMSTNEAVSHNFKYAAAELVLRHS
jgi:hypothetical protein